jgi:hypothetical protein
VLSNHDRYDEANLASDNDQSTAAAYNELLAAAGTTLVPDAPKCFAFDTTLDEALRQNYSGGPFAPAPLQLDIAGIGAALRRLPLATRLGLDPARLYGLDDAAAPIPAGAPPTSGSARIGTQPATRAKDQGEEDEKREGASGMDADAELDALLAGDEVGVGAGHGTAGTLGSAHGLEEEEEEEEEDLEDFLASVL